MAESDGLKLPWHGVRLLCIVAEAVLRERLIDDFDALGVTGYTLLEGRGRSIGGMMVDHWQGDVIEFQVVTSPEQCDRIAIHLRERYFRHHSLILYAQDVQVLRPERYR